MPRLPAIAALSLAACALPASAQTQQPSPFQRVVAHLQAGLAALGSGDTAGYLAGTRAAYDLAAGIPAVAYHHARAHALGGDADSAATLLLRLAVQGAVPAFEAPTDTAFHRVAADPRFQAAVAAIDRARTPISHSTVAYELPERDLIPEGVAWDARTGTLFLGSMYKRKIVAIGRDGGVRDFVATGADGLGPVVGMEVDPRRRVLWAAAMYLPDAGIPFPDSTLLGHGVLFKYDADSGRLLRRYVTPPADVRHGFNDVTVLPAGDVYITDSESGGVFLLRADADTVVPVVPPRTYVFPNGITRSDDGRRLFVAHGAGIDRIELPSHRRMRLTTPDSLNVAGIDGLAYVRNSLVAHQPSSFNRVIRLYLDGSATGVTRAEVIERHHPAFAIPTTGEVAGSTYYYIANSQLRAFRDGRILPWDELRPVIVLRADLK